MIYSGLLVLILTAVGGMLLTTLRSEEQVIDSGDVNGYGQLISSSVSSGVRNATALALTGNADNTVQLLVLTTVSSDPMKTAAERVCEAWYYTELNGGVMYYQRGTAPQEISPPTASDLTGWTLLGSGLSSTGQPIFTGADASSPAISLNFAIDANGGSGLAFISTTVKTRQGASTETATCF